MRKSDFVEQLADMLTRQRQDLNNGSDEQDAEEIIDFIEEKFNTAPAIVERDPVLYRYRFVWEKE